MAYTRDDDLTDADGLDAGPLRRHTSYIDAGPADATPVANPGIIAGPDGTVGHETGSIPFGTIANASPGQSLPVESNGGATGTLGDEVTFISGINPDGTLALYSFGAWNGDNPATYTGGYTEAIKWGTTTAGTPGGTVNYYFDPASSWSYYEEQVFTDGLALWSAEANVSFEQTDDPGAAQITFVRGSDGKAATQPGAVFTDAGGLTGGTVLYQLDSATVSIDTDVPGFGPLDNNIGIDGGYPWMTVLHEEGHAIGLGHAGPYNSTNASSQQFSPYDTRLWSLMSYFDNSTANVKGQTLPQYPLTNVTSWNHEYPTTPMIADILAAQRLYGAPTNTPLSGGQVFGFNSNITGDIQPFFDFTLNLIPVVTLWDAGTNNTLDLSGFSGTSSNSVFLTPGSFSSADGLTNNIAIAPGTKIDTYVGGPGRDSVFANNDGDTIYGGGGDDGIVGGTGNDTIYGGPGSNSIDGGAGTDTVGFTKNYTAYTITVNTNGIMSVTSGSEIDALRNIEYLQFADQTVPVSSLSNTIQGTSGNDSLLATGYNDAIDGGAGYNSLSYQNASAGVTVDLSLTGPQNTGGSGTDTINNIQSLYGSNYDDTLKAGAQGVTLTGLDGNDALYGGAGNDTIAGSNGNDTIYGGAGTNVIDGGAGTDTAVYSGVLAAYTLSSGASGTVIVSGLNNRDSLTGVEYLAFADQTIAVVTSTGNTLYATNGNDYVSGSNGQPGLSFYFASYLLATSSITAYLSTTTPQWTGGSGTDTLVGINGLIGSSYNDYLTGSANSDVIYGEAGDDVLSGGGGADQLYDQAGNDILNGGTGNDTLDGGAGIDTAVFSGNRSAYHVNQSGQTVTVAGPDGTDTLTNIEFLKFGNGTLTLASALQNNSTPSDFNGDGESDIVWENDDGRAMMWLMDGPAVTSSANLAITADPAWKIKATGDLYGDGTSDILWQNDDGQAVMMSMNGATITGVGQIGANNDPSWKIAVTGDFNGDGKSDILWQNDNGNVVMWLMNGASIVSNVAVGPNSGPSWHIEATGDLNGDGKSDIVWENDDGRAMVWLMNGSAVITSANLAITADPTWHVRAAGDLYGDGTSDILWQNDNGQAAFMSMNGTDITGIGALGNNTDPAWKIRATGDYNGDGKSDILWQNDNGNAVMWAMSGASILSNGGIGTNSGPAWHIASGAYTSSGTPGPHVARPDFNGDGKSDIVWESGDGHAVMWLMNGSAIASSADLAITADPAWKIKATGDLYGDGTSDILWQNDDGQAVMMSMNGTTITGVGQITANNDPSWKIVATGDFNGDGKSDILVQNSSTGRIDMWLMNGATIASSTTLTNNNDPTWRIKATGDFNGDGYADIICQNDNGQVDMWLMNGAAIVSSTVVANNDPAWKVVATGDFNADGKSDILAQNNSTGQIDMWLMNGATITSSTQIGNNTDPAWKIKATGDYNGDGMTDIIVQNIGSGRADLWMMNGTTINSSTTVDNDPSWQVAGNAMAQPRVRSDFNGDGRGDILVQNGSTGQVDMWLMNGTSLTSSTQIGNNTDPTWRIVAGGDFNGDGYGDMLWQSAGGQVNMSLMNGTIVSANATVANIGTAWNVVAAGDFNGDSKSDILVQNSSTGQVDMWLMNGAAIASSTLIGQSFNSAWKIAGIGDFNGDGKADILWQDSSTGQIDMWLMNGTTITAITLVGTNTDPNWKIVATGDFDADGKSDILLQNSSSGQVDMWQMDGTAIAASTQIGNNTDPAWKVVTTGDYNGDGRSDILWQNSNSGQTIAWVMSGTSILSNIAIGSNFDPAWHAGVG